MADVESDIAFIRSAVEGGRAYARGRSADLLIWGLFVAGGYLATYAYVRHWSSVDRNWAWAFAIGVPWIYSLRRLGARLLGLGGASAARSPMAQALSMLWLGCGISLTALAIAANWNGVVRYHWYDAAVASILGIAYFAGSALCNHRWMRYVAFAWWAGVFVLYGLRDSGLLLAVAAAMMLAFLAGPGLVLLLSGRNGE